jgi:DNA mismatch repair protein MutS2
MAALDGLREAGAKTLATTHLNLVKGYAYLEERVENAAVEFDDRTLAPTYRLHYGIPGASKAFTIARRLGLPEAVLDRAEHYLGEGERAGLELVEKINLQQRELEQTLADARRLRARAGEEQEKRKRLLRELEEQKQALLDKARRRGDQLVRDAERRIKDLLREAREGVDLPEQARLTGEIRELRSELQEPISPARPLRMPTAPQPGELLRIPALRAEGMVVRIEGDQAELSVRGKKLRLPLATLEQFSPPRFVSDEAKGGGVRSRIEREGFSPRLLLVGKRVDEALVLLDRFLDDALLHHLAELEVVHGAGEGILRRAVRDFLRGHLEVKAFHAGDIGQGGDNVTIVQLRR